MQTDVNKINYLDEKIASQKNNVPQKQALTYIRPLQPHEGAGFAVCSEQGTILACFPNYDAAYYTARQFHLVPQAVN